MRIFQISLMLFLFCSCCNEKKVDKEQFSDSFLNTILRDTRVGSFYLSIPLCNKSEYLVIQNHDLFQFLNKRKEMGREEYISEINLLFESDSCFNISEMEKHHLSSRIISTINIDKYRSSMSDSIKSMFDENGVQSRLIDDKFVNFIIHERFSSKCLIHKNDMSGRIIYKIW